MRETIVSSQHSVVSSKRRSRGAGGQEETSLFSPSPPLPLSPSFFNLQSPEGSPRG